MTQRLYCLTASVLAALSFGAFSASAAGVVREFAIVKSTGALARGAMAISSKRLTVGTYTVTFSNNVAACAYAATVASATPGAEPGGGNPKLFNLGGNGRTVEVKIGKQQEAVDRDFHLIVVC